MRSAHQTVGWRSVLVAIGVLAVALVLLFVFAGDPKEEPAGRAYGGDQQARIDFAREMGSAFSTSGALNDSLVYVDAFCLKRTTLQLANAQRAKLESWGFVSMTCVDRAVGVKAQVVGFGTGRPLNVVGDAP